MVRYSYKCTKGGIGMALINCPECNREVSDKAESCPHCGCPLNEKISISSPIANDIVEEPILKSKSSRGIQKLFVPIIVVVVLITSVCGIIYSQKVIKPKKTYEEAVSLLEKGKYEEANNLFNEISAYNDVELLQEELKYESMVYQCITSIRRYLKNPDSLQIYEVEFYKDIKENVNKAIVESLETFKTFANINPICVIRFGGQNGFGGNTTSYGMFIYTEENNSFEYFGSCDSLDVNEIDEDDEIDKITCQMINIYKDNFTSIGSVDLTRIKNIIKDESYSTIKIIK